MVSLYVVTSQVLAQTPVSWVRGVQQGMWESPEWFSASSPTPNFWKNDSLTVASPQEKGKHRSSGLFQRQDNMLLDPRSHSHAGEQ